MGEYETKEAFKLLLKILVDKKSIKQSDSKNILSELYCYNDFVDSSGLLKNL